MMTNKNQGWQILKYICQDGRNDFDLKEMIFIGGNKKFFKL